MSSFGSVGAAFAARVSPVSPAVAAANPAPNKPRRFFRVVAPPRRASSRASPSAPARCASPLARARASRPRPRPRPVARAPSAATRVVVRVVAVVVRIIAWSTFDRSSRARARAFVCRRDATRRDARSLDIDQPRARGRRRARGRAKTRGKPDVEGVSSNREPRMREISGNRANDSFFFRHSRFESS